MLFPVDGHAIDYEVRLPSETRSPAEGRDVLLVHGLTTDRRILVEACDEVLARAGLRRIYLDLPGHGASRGNPGRAGADDLVDALAAFVRATCAQPPLVVAYAFGAYLAQGLVPLVELSGLCLLCPVVEADFGKRTTPPRFIAAHDEELPFSGDEREPPAFLEVAVRQTREVLARFQAVVHPANAAIDGDVVGAVRARYAMARPYAHALPAFERPVAIACGRHDHWVGFEDACRLARMLPRSSLTVVPDCGQLLPLEAPDAVRAVLVEWLARAGVAVP